MSSIINLVEKYEPQLATFFAKRIEEIDLEIDQLAGHLIREKADLLAALDEIDAKKKLRNNGFNAYHQLTDKYSPGMSNIDKVIYFTKENKLTVHQIAEKIVEKEPGQNLTEIKNTLSAVLSMDNKRVTPRVVRETNENNKLVYMAK